MSHPASSRGTTDRMTQNRSTAPRRSVHGSSVWMVPVHTAGVIRVYHRSADGRLHGLAEIHAPPGVPLDADQVNVLLAGADKRGIPVVRIQVPPSWRGAAKPRRDVEVTRETADNPHRLDFARETRRELRTLYRAYQADARFQIETFGAALPATADIDRMPYDELAAKADDPHFKRWMQLRHLRAQRERIHRENLRYQALLGGPASGYTPEDARRIVRGSRLPPSKLGLPLYDESTGVHIGYVRTVIREKELGGAVGLVTSEIYDLEGKRLNPGAKGKVALTPAADIFQDLARQTPVLGYAINVAEIYAGESFNLRDRGRNLSDYEVTDRAISQLPLADTVRSIAESTSGVSLSQGADIERYWKGERRMLSHRERVGKLILAGTSLTAGVVGGLQLGHGPKLHPIIGRRTIGPDDISVDPVPLKPTAPQRMVSARKTEGSRHISRHATPARQAVDVKEWESYHQPRPVGSAPREQSWQPLPVRPNRPYSGTTALPEFEPKPMIILMDRHNLPPRIRSQQRGGFESLGNKIQRKVFQTGKRLGFSERTVKKSLANSLAYVSRFIKKFHDIPGFDKVLTDYLRGIHKTKYGHRMRQGARYVMEFVEANFSHSKRLLEQGEMAFELHRGSLRVMDLKVFDTRYEFKSVQAFRSYAKHLRRQLRRDLGDLLAQMPNSSQNLRWVFDEDRLRKAMQMDGLSHHEMSRDMLRLQVIKDMRDALKISFASHKRRADLERWLDDIVIVW